MTGRSTRWTALQALLPSLAVATALAAASWQLVSNDVGSAGGPATRTSAAPPTSAPAPAVAAGPAPAMPSGSARGAAAPAVVTVGDLRHQATRQDPGRATSTVTSRPAWTTSPASPGPSPAELACAGDAALRARATGRLAAAITGGGVEAEVAARTLEGLLADPVAGVRARAALALATTTAASDALVERLVLEQDAQVRQALFGALARAGGEAALPRLLAIVATTPSEAQRASETARAIAIRLGVPAPPGLLPVRSPSERRLARAQGGGLPGLPAVAARPTGRRAVRVKQAGWAPR